MWPGGGAVGGATMTLEPVNAFIGMIGLAADSTSC
jgi:hypothetical protein